MQLSIKKLTNQIENHINTSEEINQLQEQINKSQKLLSVINIYDVHDIDWMFIIIPKFLISHLDSFSTEQLLWSFCNEYFEINELKSLSSRIKNEIGTLKLMKT